MQRQSYGFVMHNYHFYQKRHNVKCSVSPAPISLFLGYREDVGTQSSHFGLDLQPPKGQESKCLWLSGLWDYYSVHTHTEYKCTL